MNDQPSSFHSGENPPLSTAPIASEKISCERKVFFLDLKENVRGRFLKITEDVGGRRDTIMLPREGFPDFIEALARLVEYSESIAGDESPRVAE
jgi:hypothetical protein